MDQLLTPRGMVLTLASFFGRGVEWFNPVRLRARGSGGWVVVVFVWGGVFVLFVLLFFFVWGLLDTCPFWGRFGLLVFVVG